MYSAAVSVLFLVVGASAADQHYNYYDSEYHQQNSAAATERQFSLDLSTINAGIFDPNNIAIHVSQNAFNFIIPQIAWAFIAAVNSGGGSGKRRKRSEDSDPVDFGQNRFEDDDEDSGGGDEEDGLKPKFNAAKLAKMLRSFADVAESVQGYFDEL